MRLNSWVKFIVLSVIVFTIVLFIMNFGNVWKAIIAFPIDWLVSFLIGAGVMFLANLNSFGKHDDHFNK